MSSDVFWKSPPWHHLNAVPQVNVPRDWSTNSKTPVTVGCPCAWNRQQARVGWSGCDCSRDVTIATNICLFNPHKPPQKTIPHFPQPQPQNFVYLSGLQLTPSIHKYCTRSYSKVFPGEVVQSAADRRDRPHTVGNGRYHFTGRPRDWPPVTGKWQNKTCILTQISSSVTAVDRRSTWTMSKIDKR